MKSILKLSLVLLICALIMTVVGCVNNNDTPHTHQYSEEITKAPTCTEEGVKTFTCSVEGCDKPTYTEPVAKLPHTEVKLDGKAATCTESGLTEGKKCSLCGEITVKQETIPATEHTEETLAAVAPTCTETGLTEGKKCSQCGTEIVAQNTVPATGHKYDDKYDATCNNEGCDFVRVPDCRHANTETIPAVSATCTATGLTEGLKCKDCGEILTKQEVVSMAAHTWTLATCTAPKTCSVCKTTEGDALDHHWKPATCTDPKTCQRENCGATEGDPTGHNWKDATCTAPQICSVCTATQGDALGHTWNNATCDAPKTCSVCKATEGSKLGHDYDTATYVWGDDDKTCTATKVCKNDPSHVVTENGKVTTQTDPASCIAEGTVTYTATFTVDGFVKQTKSAKLEKLPHVYGTTSYDWSDDYKSCTAVKNCTGNNCYANISENVTAKVVTVASTCTVKGSVTYTADFKNAEFEDQTHVDELPLADHNLVSDSKPATCTETGLTEILKCTNCSYTEGTQEIIPLQPHTYDDSEGYATECSVCHTPRPACKHEDVETIKGYEATCSKEGLTDGERCKTCGATVVGQTAIAKKDHTPGAAATCTEDQICTVCTVTLKKATGHSFGAVSYEWIYKDGVIVACKASRTCQNGCGTNENETANAESEVVSDAACGQAGTKTYTAVFTTNNAFKTQTKDVTIPALEHIYTSVVTKPTCTTGGYTTHTCSKCGNEKIDTLTEKLGHSPATDDGNCTTAIVCTICGDETTPAKAAHTPEADDGDCTTAVKCANCNQTAVNANEKHTPGSDDGNCTTPIKCVNCEKEAVAGKPHTPAEKNSCVADTVCSVCKTKIADGNSNHTWSEWTSADGKHNRHCTNDGCAQTEEGVHTPEADDNDCTTAVKCSVCQAVTTEGANHDFGAWAPYNETHHKRTCQNDGCNQFETAEHTHTNDCDADCNVCGEIRTPADHVYDNDCDADCNVCDGTRVPADHVYDSASDVNCNVCGAVRTVAPTVSESEIAVDRDVFDLADKEKLVIDLALNVNNISNLTLTYSVNGAAIEGSVYTFTLGSYTEEYTYTTLTVTVSYEIDGETKTLEYTYKLGLKDTSAYRVVNGNFENGLDGWTSNNTVGEAPFAGIDDKTTFWGEGYPMFNVGKYFSSYADGASEESEGTLTSSYFTVNSKYATYMLGGAGNRNVYITLEDESGNVLALYRNTKFADFTSEDNEQSVDYRRELIGNTVFLANFVTYKVDLSAFDGQKVRFVIHDHAASGWGVVFFDELNTYYADATAVPENAVLAENLLANKTDLKAELALEVAEQGDYTLDSFNAYLEKLNAANALLNDVAASQAEVDNATAALTDARLALAVRLVEEVADANKSFKLISGDTMEIALADYINTNGLSKITYEIKADSILTLGALTDGKFSIKAGTVNAATTATVAITVNYDGVEKLKVVLTVEITNDLAPSVKAETVEKSFDIYNDGNSFVLDLSENIDNPGKLDLTYSVGGNTVGSNYTYTAGGSYTDVAVPETFTVTVSYTANGKTGTISYTYTLSIKDTTNYRLVNGGFENGLDGWTQVGQIGNVSSNKTYWAENIEFGMDGDKMFSAYEPSDMFERNVGTLTSSTFTVGGSGFVTFKVGAMRDQNYVYVDVVEAGTGKILARYYNGLWTEADKSGCKLVAYKANLSEFVGKEVFFRISDNADSGYGLFFADSFITYYESEPDGFNAATPVNYTLPETIYDLFNGGFEMGDVQGWWNVGEIGLVTNANGYWAENKPYGKHGDYLFTGVESFGADTMREGNKGVLSSSVFEIGGTGYISFMLGGGENEQCYIQIVDAATGEVLARYHQQAPQEAVLKQYVADLSAYIGRTARIQVVDYATSGWGCVSFDNVVTYYPEGKALPADHIVANNIFGGKYTVDNGSFETGNLDGWGLNGDLGVVTDKENAGDWYTPNGDTKDGNYLFTFAPEGANYEGGTGTLASSTFTLKKNSYVSFKFGGAGGVSNRNVWIELVRADGEVIARFYNEAEGKVNTKMNAFFYQYTGESADFFFRVVDNANSDYGCFVVDDFRVNLESAPEGYLPAVQ